ncbi:hypothetical protein BS47DRAFT_1357680 [Hydnum rufescens UP504]|uniref:Uncharacterized protein n=1 Tax=Hydnum rufescens UP504 TaxID=1448309 RepID=A0A9P6B9P7_9AGAM|nr:hypothetical protein BS47DRAFT_1357680 [Hydnum rufescens UP504]
MHVQVFDFCGMTVEEIFVALVEPLVPERLEAASQILEMVGALDAEQRLTSLGWALPRYCLSKPTFLMIQKAKAALLQALFSGGATGLSAVYDYPSSSVNHMKWYEKENGASFETTSLISWRRPGMRWTTTTMMMNMKTRIRTKPKSGENTVEGGNHGKVVVPSVSESSFSSGVQQLWDFDSLGGSGDSGTFPLRPQTPLREAHSCT